MTCPYAEALGIVSDEQLVAQDDVDAANGRPPGYANAVQWLFLGDFTVATLLAAAREIERNLWATHAAQERQSQENFTVVPMVALPDGLRRPGLRHGRGSTFKRCARPNWRS